MPPSLTPSLTPLLSALPLAIPFPDIDPWLVRFEVAGRGFPLRWYALAYVAALLIGWWLAARALGRERLWPGGRAPMDPADTEALMTWTVLGVIAGGRLGYVLFYRPSHYLANPLEIPAVWDGGMSFHGGLLGVIAVWALFARAHDVPRLQLADLMCLVTPPGLLLGRLANFVNAELWGRPTDLPWGVIFPGPAAQACADVAGLCARHPSQLYEAVLEGVLLLALIVFLAFRRGWLKRPGQICGIFLIGYAISRILVELVRQADPQFITTDNPMGYVVQIGAAGLSMGQLLTLPMLAVGAALILNARAR